MNMYKRAWIHLKDFVIICSAKQVSPQGAISFLFDQTLLKWEVKTFFAQAASPVSVSIPLKRRQRGCANIDGFPQFYL